MEAVAVAATRLLRAPPPPWRASAAGRWWRRSGPVRRRVVRVVPPRASVLLDAAVAGTTGYSPASYYTSLGLFVLSVPGLWSLIKRSVKSKIVQKTFVKEGGETMAPNQVAGKILSFFTRNNFTVSGRGEVITCCLRSRESIAGDGSESTWEKWTSKDPEIMRDTKRLENNARCDEVSIWYTRGIVCVWKEESNLERNPNLSLVHVGEGFLHGWESYFELDSWALHSLLLV